MRSITHIILHFFLPGIISRIAYKDKWIQKYMIMMFTMIIDLDHLIANPIYDPNRCSIGFHPLHSYVAISLYILITFVPKSRILGIGLLVHIGLDFLDCVWMRFF
ncbi:MAG: hypothetical protein HQK76_08170 [Desulfobacterales bacterium]|nr:hypothetical protein [Desulfobacterales bacterium]